jgi:hypothetical protein
MFWGPFLVNCLIAIWYCNHMFCLAFYSRSAFWSPLLPFSLPFNVAQKNEIDLFIYIFVRFTSITLHTGLCQNMNDANITESNPWPACCENTCHDNLKIVELLRLILHVTCTCNLQIVFLHCKGVGKQFACSSGYLCLLRRQKIVWRKNVPLLSRMGVSLLGFG